MPAAGRGGHAEVVHQGCSPADLARLASIWDRRAHYSHSGDALMMARNMGPGAGGGGIAQLPPRQAGHPGRVDVVNCLPQLAQDGSCTGGQGGGTCEVVTANCAGYLSGLALTFIHGSQALNQRQQADEAERRCAVAAVAVGGGGGGCRQRWCRPSPIHGPPTPSCDEQREVRCSENCEFVLESIETRRFG